MEAEANLEDIAMVPIMRLRKTKRTDGVNQLFMDAQIEGIDDTDSSNMAFGRRTVESEVQKWRYLWSMEYGPKWLEDYS